MRALRRRSQRDRFVWKRLESMTEILWPRVSIRHPCPDLRGERRATGVPTAIAEQALKQAMREPTLLTLGEGRRRLGKKSDTGTEPFPPGLPICRL